MILKFDNDFAQAWFRSSLHRAAVAYIDPSDEDVNRLLWIREASYNEEVSLYPYEVQLALTACEKRIGDDPAFVEARQDIVNQLKAGIAGADKKGLS